MRYEDWDILLFPQNCKVPVKEFKVACHVVHDPESLHFGGTFGLPTVCCFVPSLPAGTPFRVSIHSWNVPTVSKFTNSYSKFPENVQFEARLFIDGRLVAASAMARNSPWPHIVAHSLDFSKSGDLEALSFPGFREELLQQDYWSPADDLGRIKLVLSEGFPRDSMTTPLERVKNIVAFSFQHAPLEVLETSSIAWPNPSMWRRAPFAASMQVPTFQPDDSESHAHSPQRRASSSERFSHAVDPTQSAGTNSALIAGGRRVTHPAYGPFLYPTHNGSDLFGQPGPYFQWLNDMSMSMGLGTESNQFINATRGSATQKSTTRTSTDVSMSDYVPMSSNGQCAEQQVAPETLPDEGERHSTQPKVPTNTPTTADVGYKRDGLSFPILTNATSFPSDLADSLTNSLLNQPLPMNSAFRTPATEVRSRKEHLEQQLSAPSPTTVAGASENIQHRPTIRHVSQQLYMPLGVSIPVAKSDMDATSPNTCDYCVLSATQGNALQAGCPSRKPSTDVLDDEARLSGEKGAKRIRKFTPASARAIDDEEGTHRPSPRVRLTSFLDGPASTDATVLKIPKWNSVVGREADGWHEFDGFTDNERLNDVLEFSTCFSVELLIAATPPTSLREQKAKRETRTNSTKFRCKTASKLTACFAANSHLELARHGFEPSRRVSTPVVPFKNRKDGQFSSVGPNRCHSIILASHSMLTAAQLRSQAENMARLSLKFPTGTLQSTLENSSHYFLEDRETHVMARSVKTWLSENKTQLPPTGHTSFSSDLKSLERSFETDLRSLEKVAARKRADSTVRSSIRDSVRGSILLGAVRYEDMVPGLAPRPGEEFENLQQRHSRFCQDGNQSDRGALVPDDDMLHATGIKLALIITALCFAVFVMALGWYTERVVPN
ncbi:hypothetical protein NOR_08294 [Metarhizium rileyi]|uniref:NADH dehydrogenase (Ubiquinone)-like protein n=1 Tax=Metarhizium rileyi (strain RCEF 4871) TaxID=1649241 RepID=A0A166WIY9_METRR|nr:hypothetical protein NOR_08294 [Metarhizium rileyi RCEF 4871]